MKINQEFTKSLPTASSRNNPAVVEDEDPEIEQLLEEESQRQEAAAAQESQHETKTIKQSPEKSIMVIKKTEKSKMQSVKSEAAAGVTETDMSDKEMEMHIESTALYTEEEEQLDDDGNMFGEEIYDIMEIENEGGDNMYLEESKQLGVEDEGEFILVNFKSSNEDLTDEKDQQFVVEELYEEEPSELKPTQRKKHVNRMPREIIDKYAQSTENNQHICTKCVKVFSTRTNLIRHIQSHDGYKAYICQICSKGFTQSGSLKQHMYIHSGERPYRCNYCDRAFTQGKTLKFHMRRHTEEKPFSCTECSACFRQRDGLKRHLKSRHNIELKFDRNNQLNDKVISMVNEVGIESELETKINVLAVVKEQDEKS